MKLGIEKNAMIRVRAGISYALTEAMDDGHCGVPTDVRIPMMADSAPGPAVPSRRSRGRRLPRPWPMLSALAGRPAGQHVRRPLTATLAGDSAGPPPRRGCRPAATSRINPAGRPRPRRLLLKNAAADADMVCRLFMTQSSCAPRSSVASIQASTSHSALIPAALMIGHHFSISAF
jgi:hypothetical protein